jgi:hypothetical protein
MHRVEGRLHHAARLGGAGVIAALLLAALPFATAQAAARPLQINANYDNPFLYGYGPNSAVWKISWRDRDGDLKARRTVTADRSGYWSLESSGGAGVERGDEIAATVGARSTSLVVPRLVVSVDRTTDVMSVTTEPGTTVYLEACSSSGFRASQCAEFEGTGGGDGTISRDFSGELDLRGGGYVGTQVSIGTHSVHKYSPSPSLRVYRGGSSFDGAYRAGSKLTVELRSGGTLKADWQGQGSDWGEFYGSFTSDDGDRQKAQAGDRIVAPKIGFDADWVVPAVEAGTKVATDVVSGTCVPGGAYRVEAQSATGSRWGERTGRADASGAFAIDMTKKIDIRTGDSVTLECKLDTGDVVARRTVAG